MIMEQCKGSGCTDGDEDSPGDSSWRENAACIGMDIEVFFPGENNPIKQAQNVCRGCLVMVPCLEYALGSVSIKGVWGGASEKERKRIIRARQK